MSKSPAAAKAAHAALLALVMAAVALLGRASLPPLALAEQWLADFRLARLAPPLPTHPDIVVAAITEDTLRLFPYRSPVDRAFLAGLLGALEAKGARAVGMDILLDQPTEPEKDEALRQALASARIPVRVSYAQAADGLTADQSAWLDAFLPPAQRGLANLAKDPLDDTARWIFPGRADGQGGFQPGLAPALAGDVGAAAARASLLSIAWRPGAPAFRVIPAHLVPLVPQAWLSGKIVLVGADVPLEDRHRTPFSAGAAAGSDTMAGILVHAHALATLLEGQGEEGAGWGGPAALTLAAALAGAGAALLSWPLAARLAGSLAVVGAGWAAAFWLVRQGGPALPLVTPTLAYALAAWGMEVVGHRDTLRHRRFIKQAFAQYIAPELVEQLARDPASLSLRGEKRELTFLFTDLAGFTQMSESLEPEAVTAILNDYLDGICAAVLAQGGTITDFIGDAVFATFGAPVAQPDHRERAIACARAIGRFSEEFRARQARQGMSFGETRMGLHTGQVVIGNIGSRHRFKYAPVGDAVNTASRLEGLNKYFGTRICISAPALPEAERAFARPMGGVVLKGRGQALEVFELLDRNPAQAERAAEWLATFEALPGDGQALERWAADHPGDGLAAFHLERRRQGLAPGPIVMTGK